MLDFPQEFFLEETREDFVVDSTMKSFWAAELEVLREIAEICERHNWQWYMAYGSLLGTVRHEGFVPWDDDIDIWMKREDYNEFLKVASAELPQGYFIESPQTEKGYTEFHTCIFNADNVSTSAERLLNFHGCPFAAGVDIFPLDYLPRDEEEREALNGIIYLIYATATIIGKKDRTESDDADILESLDTIEDVCGVFFHREWLETEKRDNIQSELFNLANQYCSSYKEADGDELVMYIDYVRYNWLTYPKEWFSEAIQMPFEGFLVPVPVSYHVVLTKIYGDYSVRMRNVASHEYPLYKKQLEHVREVTEELEEKVARVNELIAQAKQKRLEQQEEEKC